MEHDEDVQILGSMSDYLVEKLNEGHNDEFITAYLKADFLTSAAISLSTLRHDAGLTQVEVAEQLHTKQSAIARLEADFDGTMSLRRYVDFALACGVIPHNLTFVPINIARNFTMTQPEVPLTFENEKNWYDATFQLAGDGDSTGNQEMRVMASSATTLHEAEFRSKVVESQIVQTRKGAA